MIDRPCAAAMQLYVKLLWPVIIIIFLTLVKNGEKRGKKEIKLRSKQWKGKAPVGRPTQSYVVVVVVAVAVAVVAVAVAVVVVVVIVIIIIIII